MKNRIHLIAIFMLLNTSLAQAADFRENLFTFLAVIMVVMVVLLMLEDTIGVSIFKITDRVIDSIHRILNKLGGNSPDKTPVTPVWPSSFIWFTTGFILGFLSLNFLSVSPVIPLYLKALDVLLAPIAVALISRMIARNLAIKNPTVSPRSIFWKTFWGSLGFLLIRFAFAA